MVNKILWVAVAVVIVGTVYAHSVAAAPTPISTFPFDEDFETGILPAEIEEQSGAYADAYVTGDASNNSSYGVMMEGNTSTGWGATPYTVTAAFDEATKSSHFSSLVMEIIPNGILGQLYIEFDHRQGYSFNSNYSWFRVLVNGSPISAVNGSDYYQPATHTDSWKTLRYNLTPYMQDSSISVTLQTSNKYYYNYYYEGDISMIDNLHVVHVEVIDDDNIDDDWEILYFGDLTTADDTTDYDGDGYSDLQEFINQQNGEKDPEGKIYDPTLKNAAGGTGYALAISTFPFEADFENGTLPAQIMALSSSESSVYLTADAANSSGYGVMMEGNNYTEWFGTSTSTTYTQAFVDNHAHISTLEMYILPSGAADNLVLEFDHRQNYSFGPVYSWFRVLVNGSPVMDIDGKAYYNPLLPAGDDWNTLRYDLTPYQNDAIISVSLQASNKYYYNYQGSGDASMIDNLHIWYESSKAKKFPWVILLPAISKAGQDNLK